jgi:hypothetical protein
VGKNDIPPIRVGEDGIEIDAKKGKWPFMRMVRGVDGELFILIDSNEAGSVMGRTENMAAITLSKKKTKAIEEFLVRTGV